MKDIVGYEGLYAVTSCGKVWSYKRQRFLKPYEECGGYLKVSLSKDGVIKRFKVHRLVAETYIPNPEEKTQVNHLDENKQNNTINNLTWVTPSENINYGTRSIRAKENTLNSNGLKPVYCIELDRTFGSIAAAARFLEVSPQTISNCVRGLTQTAKGYHWSYVKI